MVRESGNACLMLSMRLDHAVDIAGTEACFDPMQCLRVRIHLHPCLPISSETYKIIATHSHNTKHLHITAFPGQNTKVLSNKQPATYTSCTRRNVRVCHTVTSTALAYTFTRPHTLTTFPSATSPLLSPARGSCRPSPPTPRSSPLLHRLQRIHPVPSSTEICQPPDEPPNTSYMWKQHVSLCIEVLLMLYE